MKLNYIKRTAHRHGLDLVLISLDPFCVFFLFRFLLEKAAGSEIVLCISNAVHTLYF